MDNIKIKLDRIDAQLRPISIYDSLIAAAPLLIPALSLIAGIILSRTIHLPLLLSLTLCFLCAVAAIALLFLKPSRSVTYAIVSLTSLAFLSLATARCTAFSNPRPNDIRTAVAGQRILATLKGTILTAPRVSTNDDWAFRVFTHGDPGSSFYLDVTSAETSRDTWTAIRGTIFVHVAEPILDLAPGDSILIYCWLHTFTPATNPGQFDFAKYMASRGVFVSASVDSRDALTLLSSGRSNLFSKLTAAVRSFTSAALLSDIPEADPARGLLEALLLGSRRNIDPASYRDFQRTGLAHFISLSGMHVAILIAAVWFAAGFTGLLKPGRAAICIIVITLFLMVVPHRPPTIRAAIICYIFCLSCLLRRHPNSLNTLSLAAIITLLINPADLFTAGWQLSFAAVLGILLLHPPLYEILWRPLACLFDTADDKPKPLPLRIAYRVASSIITALSVSLSAWLAVAGILLYHFHAITPLASLWTVLALPFFTLILTLGLIKILIAFALPTLAAALGLLITRLADFLLWLVSLMAHVTASEILIGSVPLFTILIFYAMLLFVRFARLPRPIFKTVTLSVLICFLPLHLATLKYTRAHHNDLTITCLDVGHGQSILAQLPAGPNILFDAGSMYNKDIGTRVVAPYMRYLGRTSLDALVISHNDSDHINGLPEVAQLCKIKNVYAPPQFLTAAQTRGTAKFLCDQLRTQNLDVTPLTDPLPISTHADLHLLWPPAESAMEALSDNDASAVLLIEYAGHSILLCSDIEKLAQNRLLAANPNLKADILIVPHHGSLATLDPKFLDALDPQILICSCSQSAIDNHQTLTTFKNKTILHTPTHGAIFLTITPSGQLRTTTTLNPQ